MVSPCAIQPRSPPGWRWRLRITRRAASSEFHAALQAVADLQNAVLGVGFADGFVGLDQDVTGLDLLNHMRLTAGLRLSSSLKMMQARGRTQDGVTPRS